MTVEFTDFAKSELQQIYNHYSFVASDLIALQIIERILDDTERLKDFPKSGQREFLLADMKKEYRYIVSGNFKVIYYCTTDFVYVTDVFDTRQSPDKIMRNA